MCSYKVKEVDADGNLVFTSYAKDIISKSKQPYFDLPCSRCKLDKLNGTNYNHGRDVISMDNLKNGYDDFDSVEPTEEHKYEKNFNEEEPDVILLPIDTLLHINQIMRTLDNETRLLIEYKLTYPSEMISDCAKHLGLDAIKCYSMLKKAKDNNPILMYLLDKSRYNADQMIKLQKEKDLQQYNKNQQNIEYLKQKPSIYKKIQPLVHFFNLSKKEIKKYEEQYVAEGLR